MCRNFSPLKAASWSPFCFAEFAMGLDAPRDARTHTHVRALQNTPPLSNACAIGCRRIFSRVHTPDADIDVLCLAPRHCSRDAFFTSFCEMLGDHPEIDELFPVPEAYTPVSFREEHRRYSVVKVVVGLAFGHKSWSLF